MRTDQLYIVFSIIIKLLPFGVECRFHYTVKPVWNNLWKDQSPICGTLYLLLNSMQTEPVWNDHLSGKTTFP